MKGDLEMVFLGFDRELVGGVNRELLGSILKETGVYGPKNVALLYERSGYKKEKNQKKDGLSLKQFLQQIDKVRHKSLFVKETEELVASKWFFER